MFSTRCDTGVVPFIAKFLPGDKERTLCHIPRVLASRWNRYLVFDRQIDSIASDA